MHLMAKSRIPPSQIRPNRPRSCESDGAIEERATIEDRMAEQELSSRKEDQVIRKWLIKKLLWTSLAWLSFTSIVVSLQGLDCFPWFSLTDAVIIAFLATSLGTVLGLLGIGLGYYFAIKR